MTLKAAMYPGERLNAGTHLMGLLVAVPAVAWLAHQALGTGSGRRFAVACVFGAALIALFAASTLCHSTRGPRQRLWVRLDHCAIFLLIAGTMTPFAVLTGDGWLRWVALASVWIVSLWGIRRTVWGDVERPMLKVYLAIGWLATMVCIPALQALPVACVTLFVAGAAAYTVGTYFFANPGCSRHAHGIWHLFVVIGSGCHFGAVAHCVLA